MDSKSNISLEFHSPYDTFIPDVTDSVAKFYTDLIRVYLSLCSGTTTLEKAIEASEVLKNYSEFAKNPIDPTVLPINDVILNKLITNLKTLKKYNLQSADSIRSACNFAFLIEQSPLTNTDFRVLEYFTKDPLSTYQNASEIIGIAPRTVSSALQRLQQRNGVRFFSLMDQTAFGLQRVIIFFVIQNGLEWTDIEDGLAAYPFTKTIVKTVTTDIGYASFVIPGYGKNLPTFLRWIHSLKNTVFSYMSLHIEEWSGVHSNLSLLKNQNWMFPSEIMLDHNETSPRAIIQCSGPNKELTEQDFSVATELVLNARITPTDIHRKLMKRGWGIDVSRINRSIRKLFQNKIISPCVNLSGIGLTANLCAEIICEQELSNQIISSFCSAPSSIFYVSNNGLIMWLMVPSEHQVQYCQLLEKLENEDGVEQVMPFLTIKQKGSRNMLDLVKGWKYEREGWWVPKEELDIRKYILDNL